ncbi:AbrB/MazE/SpoVT family DNA-binding domain-containing protein [Pleurocapsales cyanobacterium LEGE 06147]|nr:AbrB/MazE/SpoVT family DNA-binding domain-containing protein [Pleurocapsales cyanobacterium LEGE 06147]
MQLTSKLTAKYQATIPKQVREQLNLQAGDRVMFVIEGDRIIIQKASSIDWDYLDAVSDTLGEWSSEADEEAYGDL